MQDHLNPKVAAIAVPYKKSVLELPNEAEFSHIALESYPGMIKLIFLQAASKSLAPNSEGQINSKDSQDSTAHVIKSLQPYRAFPSVMSPIVTHQHVLMLDRESICNFIQANMTADIRKILQPDSQKIWQDYIKFLFLYMPMQNRGVLIFFFHLMMTNGPYFFLQRIKTNNQLAMPSSLFQALAYILKIDLYLWQFDKLQRLVCYRAYPYHASLPATQTVNLLVNGNQMLHLPIKPKPVIVPKRLAVIASLFQHFPNFSVINDSQVEFNFYLQGGCSIEQAFFDIFTKLERFHIGKAVCDHFLEVLKDCHRDFKYGYPDNRLFTEIRAYRYQKETILMLFSKKRQFRSPILREITFSGYPDGRIELSIESNTLVDHPFISDQLKSVNWPGKQDEWYDQDTPLPRINFLFNLNYQSKKTILNVFEQIFKKLIMLTISYVSMEDQSFFEINLCDYCDSIDQGLQEKNFPKKEKHIIREQWEHNSILRKNRRLPKKNQLSIAAFNQSRRELLVLFRKGARAKSLVSTGRTLFEILWFYGCNKSDEGFKETLSCAKAVLDYGDPNQRNFSNKTADESIANALAMTKLAPHFLSFDYMKHRLELLALLKSAPEIEPRIIVHPYFEKEEWGKIIRYGNLLIINNHAKAISINNITVRLNSTLDLLTSDGKVFSVKTRFASVKFNKPLFDIDKAEDKKLKERLCFIFRKSFPHVSEDVDFAGILERALAVKTGTVYLDLLCLGTEVYGFSIAEVVDKNPDGTPIMLDGQPIIIHHLRLAATILKYPQIMSYLMHPRGFALLYHELKKTHGKLTRKVFTVWDAVTYYSLMLQGLENYPKYNSLEELIIAAKKAVYNNDILPDPENGLYYCSDDGLSEKYEQQSPFFNELLACYDGKSDFAKLQRKISKEVIQENFMRQNKSVLAGFENNLKSMFWFVKNDRPDFIKIVKSPETVLTPDSELAHKL